MNSATTRCGIIIQVSLDSYSGGTAIPESFRFQDWVTKVSLCSYWGSSAGIPDPAGVGHQASWDLGAGAEGYWGSIPKSRPDCIFGLLGLQNLRKIPLGG